MKGLSSKHIALKVDVTEAENILFTGASFVEVLQAGAVMGLYRRRLIHKTRTFVAYSGVTTKVLVSWK